MAVGASGVSGLFWAAPVTAGNLASWLAPGVLGDSGIGPTGPFPPSGAAGGALSGTYPNPSLASVIVAGGPTGSSSQVPVITYNAAGQLTAVTTAAITISVGANPTASIGLTAVNGVATTFMRSDAAPVIDLTAAFAFTGLGATTIADTTDASSTTTGALKVAGGVGIAKKLFTGTGITNSSGNIQTGAGDQLVFNGRSRFESAADGSFGFKNNAQSIGLILSFPASATWQLGAANVDTGPVNQTLQAQGVLASGTSNVAGANLTIASGQGKGNATGSSLIFQTPAAVASGTGAQTMTNTLALTASSGGAEALVGTTTANGNAAFGAVRINGSTGSILDFMAGGTKVGRLLYDGTNLAFSSQSASVPVYLGINNAPKAQLMITSFNWNLVGALTFGATIASEDLFLGRLGAAQLRLGDVTGSGAAVAQTLTVQGSSGNSAAAALFTIAGSDQSGTTTTGGGVKIRGGNGTSAGGTVEIWTSATTTPTMALRMDSTQALVRPKLTDPATAPGAGLAKTYWVAGTNAGTAKLICYAGTSTTPVTIVDNVGTGF